MNQIYTKLIIALIAAYFPCSLYATELNFSDAADPGGNWEATTYGARLPFGPNYTSTTSESTYTQWSGNSTKYSIDGSGYPDPGLGSFRPVMYYCKGATSPTTCTIAKAYTNISSESGISFGYSDWGSQGAKTFSFKGYFGYGISMCLAFNAGGKSWRPGGTLGFFCSDATTFSSTPIPKPTSCSFDMSGPTIDFGSVDKKNIKTTLGTAGDKVQNIKVKCSSAQSKIDTTLKFSYSGATSILGKTLIDTGKKGVGVAVFYENQVVKPDQSYTRTLPNGSSNFNVGFSLLRSPDTALSDIKTGAFSASATLIMNLK